MQMFFNDALYAAFEVYITRPSDKGVIIFFLIEAALFRNMGGALIGIEVQIVNIISDNF